IAYGLGFRLLAFSCLAGVIGDVPACAFELDCRRRNLPLQLPATLATLGERLVAQLLKSLDVRLAFFTFVLVNRHAAIINAEITQKQIGAICGLPESRASSMLLPERCLTLLNLFL